MPDVKRRFIRVLKVELEDLREDVNQLMAECLKRAEERNSSHYVTMENLAVLQAELNDIGRINAFLDGLDLDVFPDLGALIKHLGERFRHRLVSQGYSGGVDHMINRKLEKIAAYVRSAAR